MNFLVPFDQGNPLSHFLYCILVWSGTVGSYSGFSTKDCDNFSSHYILYL